MTPLPSHLDPADPRLQRVEELLADRAVAGLGPAEEAELALLRDELGLDAGQAVTQDDALARTAALLDLALTAGSTQPVSAHASGMPEAIRARLIARGQAWCQAVGGTGTGTGPVPANVDLAPLATLSRGDMSTAGPVVITRRPRAWLAWGGWAAAAASLAITALIATRPAATPGGSSLASAHGTALADGRSAADRGDPSGTSSPAGFDALALAEDDAHTALVRTSPVAQYDDFVTRSTEHIEARLEPAIDPALMGADELTGRILWDPAQQRGFLVVAGLPANASADQQFQVWIFDENRDEPYPVDGGLFDIPHTGGTYVIPISSRVHVHQPRGFAITVERAGGTVVSSPERIVAAGSPEGVRERLRVPTRRDAGPPAPPISSPMH